MRPKTTLRHGFTLIELLVTVAILAVLVGLTIPGLKIVREQAELTTCRSNLRQYSAAALVYANDYESYLPIGFVLEGGSNGYHGTSSYWNAWCDYNGGANDGPAAIARIRACPAANRIMGVKGQGTVVTNSSLVSQFQPTYCPAFTNLADISHPVTSAFLFDCGMYNYQGAGGFYAPSGMFIPPIMPHRPGTAWTQTGATPAYANGDRGIGYFTTGQTLVAFFDGHVLAMMLDATGQNPDALPWPRPGLNLRMVWNLFWNDSNSKS